MVKSGDYHFLGVSSPAMFAARFDYTRLAQYQCTTFRGRAPRCKLRLLVLVLVGIWCKAGTQAEQPLLESFAAEVEPLLSNYCYDCHGYGMAEGKVSLDRFAATPQLLADRQLWWRVLKMLQTRLMPPADQEQPTDAEIERLQQWIKNQSLGLDLQHPDPGRGTLRRLNRVEYRNTVRDLLGVDYNTTLHFPPEDTGHGFDNLGDVLTMSPLHVEKYLEAAEAIVAEAMAMSPEEIGDPQLRALLTGTLPEDVAQRREVLEESLERFTTRAYRRPLAPTELARLIDIAEQCLAQGDPTESAVAQVLTVVLSSPRFLYRLEEAIPNDRVEYPLVDEYTLAARLSYFLWSTMPDEELLNLADEGQLREKLPQQVQRMQSDPRWSQFIDQFVGQWLRTRDIQHLYLDVIDILQRDGFIDTDLQKQNTRLSELLSQGEQSLTPEEKTELKQLRKALRAERESIETLVEDKYRGLRPLMRQETELHFEHIFRHDRSLLELIDCDYAFLNARLAQHYAIEGVQDDAMQLVSLPADSPRGGVLTQGTFLATTSNPNRTSPVKRGVYILENILGIPPAPPPPDVPELSDQDDPHHPDPPTLRESLALHREDPLCSSCHSRMDPLGLAFENFNALGMWREHDRGQPIDSSGTLVRGQLFADVQEFKRILLRDHQRDFYRCLTEKMLTFAIGRGLEYYDVQTVDMIVDRLEESGGKPSELIAGIVHSAPFQRKRREEPTVRDTSADRRLPLNVRQ